MLKELRGMTGERPIEPEELDKVKQQQILELPGSHETMNAVGNLFGDLLQLGLPLDFYNGYVSRVRALTTQELEACARELLDPEKMIWMIVGDRATLEPALRDLGIGDVVGMEA
jgi:zinc protease